MPDHPSNQGAKLLPTIRGPEDLKRLAPDELPKLAAEIRDEILAVTSVNGGHVGPNLGVVELTIALHRVFSTPEDQFVMDVSHQGYVHKLLTGRQGKRFQKIRKSDGLSGFLARSESEHDSWGAGHAGTALSAALGMATARDLRGSNEHVVALIGDAALTCGISMEALNNVATATKRLIIVLNDNEWSISRNVGALSKYLTELITNPVYNRIHDDFGSLLRKMPGGNSVVRLASKAKLSAKNIVAPASLFEKYGVRYIGPIDGHDIPLLVKNLEFAKTVDEPVFLHVITTKGRGYDVAIRHPEKFHGTSPFDIETGKSKGSARPTAPAYQDVFGSVMVSFAAKDKRVIGITAAMASGTGLSKLAQEAPEQFFDVGIAEEHAVLFAGGLATKGFHPVCAIYSTFLQRAFDQIVHDICLQNLPVTFAMDRAGISPNDGPTHHGLYDLSYLRCVPNATVMQPRNEDELVDMLHTSLETPAPMFIRYPRGAAEGVRIKDNPQLLEIGKAETIREGENIAIWALGPMVKVAIQIADRLKAEEGLNATVVNARFVKPLDRTLLLKHADQTNLIVTMEDHTLPGGFGSAVQETLMDARRNVAVERIGWPDEFVDHGSSVESLREAYGLSPEAIYDRILARI
ncbi:MAG TPA: 1-deoxy-D-xylulose-5-phosphate synthase, partial [Opitutales bacterium]|nr:1-deoxy-D-xylulose-5-phosphate synthase [Opitutales bacterium]